MHGRVGVIILDRSGMDVDQIVHSLHESDREPVTIVTVRLGQSDFGESVQSAEEHYAPSFPAGIDEVEVLSSVLNDVKSDWWAIVDCPCMFHQNYFTRLIDALEVSGALVGYVDLVSTDGVVHKQPGYWQRRLSDGMSFVMNGFVFSRKLLETGLRPDPSVGILHSWDWLLQCAEVSDFLHYPAETLQVNAFEQQASSDDEPTLQASLEAIARKWRDRYAKLKHEADEILTRCDALMGEKRFAEALSQCQLGLAVDPGHPSLLNRAAVCQRMLGKPAAALMALRRACDVDRHSFRLLSDLIVMEARFGSLETAHALLKQAGELVAGDDDKTKLAGITSYVADR